MKYDDDKIPVLINNNYPCWIISSTRCTHIELKEVANLFCCLPMASSLIGYTMSRRTVSKPKTNKGDEQ